MNREIKFRVWEKKRKNKYSEDLKNFRECLYKKGERFGNSRYAYEKITLEMWEKENNKNYNDGVIYYYEMNYSPYIEDNECLGEFSLCDLNKCLQDKNKILMQYTGLKDKNGKEIYEGDIVKGEWDVVEEIYVSDVQFYGGAFRVHKTGLPLEYGYMRRECEVIGNIYENPELLDKD